MTDVHLRFNGYRVDLRASSSSFPAANPSLDAEERLPNGMYQVIAERDGASLAPFEAALDQCHAAPLQTRTQPHQWRIRSMYSNMCHAPGDAYLYDHRTTPVTGIRVDPMLFFHLESAMGDARMLPQITLEVAYAAPWMATVVRELGIKEKPGTAANARILEYFKASKFWGKDDTGVKNAWCGSFAAWVMSEHGYTPPKNAFRAKAWKNFGKKIDAPVYGAIGIKSRVGGGHVSFVFGQSSDGKHLFMLGGNQDDTVKISKYNVDVWTDFVVPADYDSSADSLPVYEGPQSAAGSEG